jgi:hypothetical protein
MDENEETGCCKRFDPKPWTDKEIIWKDKLFLKDHVTSIFHIPLNFGQMVVKNMERIKAAGSEGEQLMICDESTWGSDVYIAVSKAVPGAKMEKISGTFLSRAFEGPFQNMGKWIKEMDSYVKSKGKTTRKMYFFYTTCPACAKAYGKNYTVILAEI